MTRFVVTVRAQREDHDLLVRGDARMSLRQLCAAAGLGGRYYVNGREVPPDASLADAGVGDGAVISDEPGSPRVPVAAPESLALLVASGPAAGASVSLLPGGHVIGREAPVWLGDDEVSRRHFWVGMARDGAVTIADAGSRNGTMAGGQPVTAERPLVPGELIWAGRSALMVASAPAADAALSPGDDGYLRFSRSPRLARRPSAARVAMPDPPAEPEGAPFPVLAVVAPVLAGLLMAVLLKQLEYLAFIALSPIMLIGNNVSDRRRGKRGYQQRLADYTRRHTEAQTAMAVSRQAELSYQRHVHPDPATLLLIACAPSHRLWERHQGDEDFLSLRIGTGTVPWLQAEPGWPGKEPGAAGDDLTDAPAVLHLPECGSVGLAGPPDRTRALARGMLLSLAVLHSPRDVPVTVLTGPRAAGDWDWLRWLPHARQPDTADCVVRIGNDQESLNQRLSELAALLEAHLAEVASGRPSPAAAGGHVVVLDGAHQLRLDPRVGALLQHGPAVGMYFLCLDDSLARLPPECRKAVVELADDHGAIVAHVRGPRYSASNVSADVLSARACEAGARAMAPLRETAGPAAADSLPSSVRFLETAKLEPPSASQIRSRWAAGGRTTRALLGSKGDGPFVLDLAQGPHLLVAGTTGSGKSELLQTLIASLAIQNRPDAMNFVLVDYKGGAAFQACEPLPHTVGVVTDLDEFEVDRALTSLRAELQRRKTVLSQAGKSNVELYWDALPASGTADPLPRLVIVVDEFAVMAEQQPDQLRSLVDIGMQGRSLGIHLVLATQRPAGVVTADLRANINLRIALRVASPDDSRDVIETSEAASIPATGCAGRAYAWLGGGRPVMFQAARVGGLRPGARPSHAGSGAVPFGWEELGRSLGRPQEPQPDPTEPTDLSTLVIAIRQAAEGQVPPQASPWRPQLPEVLPAGQIRVLAAEQYDLPLKGALRLVFGLVDQPPGQRQVPAVFDLERGGHLLIAGTPQSGRTTVLRTLAGCLADQVNPDDAHLYAIDGGSGLAALSALPHCGVVVTAAETDRLDRLLARLSGELSRRARLLSASGCGDLAEYRQQQADNRPPPFLLVLVDRYEAVAAAVEHVDNGRLIGELQRLVRDGLAAGIRVVFTGDRSLLTGRLAALCEDKIMLRMADRTDYALGGLSAKAIPAAMPSGRGFRLPAGDMLQVALLSGEQLGAAENQALRAAAARSVRPAARPFRVDPLPAAISYEQACQLPGRPESGILVGVGGDDLAQVRVDTPALLVMGRAGSGRSTALAVQARSLSASGTPLVLVTPRRSALPAALGPAALALHLTTTGTEAVASLSQALSGSGPAGIVVDDAELVVGTPLGDELLAVSRGIRDHDRHILAATGADPMLRGLALELAHHKCGLILEPASAHDGQPFGARLPLSVLGSGVTLRAALIHDGKITNVQVPELTNLLAEAAAAGTD